MATKINCFIPVQEKNQVIETVNGLKANELVAKIYLLAAEGFNEEIEGCEVVKIDSLQSTATVKKIAEPLSQTFRFRRAELRPDNLHF